MTIQKSQQIESVEIKTNYDPDKIWKGSPSPISMEAKRLLLDYLSETVIDRGGEEVFKNELKLSCGQYSLCLTLEHLYRKLQGDTTSIPKNKAAMSPECKEWAKLDRFDPCLNIVRISTHPVFKGTLYCWDDFSRSDRESIIQAIKDMPEFETTKTLS